MKQFFNAVLLGFLCLFATSFSFAQNPDAFITIWKTNEANESITIETNPDYTYNYSIDWGDGTQDTNVTGDITHNYQANGDHEVSITGLFPAFNRHIKYLGIGYHERMKNREKLTSVKQWGSQEWKTMANSFLYCTNLSYIDPASPNLSNVVSMAFMFAGATSFNQPINHWDTSNVTDMNNMFIGAVYFNQPIYSWDTSKVTDMSSMFFYATSFNQQLNTWNTANVTDMSNMFRLARSFNQPLNNWITDRVTNMEGMFCNAQNYNKPLNDWNTANVTDMRSMFTGSSSFNQPLDKWDTSKVTDMYAMFNRAFSFDQPLENWNTANVTNMNNMFSGTFFNQPINNWNTSKVTDMGYMFSRATSFDQSLENWDISNVTNMQNMLDYTNLSVQNYDKTLIGWQKTIADNNTPTNIITAYTLSTNITLGAQNLDYCADEARLSLIDEYGWTINGDSRLDLCQQDEIPFPVTFSNFNVEQYNGQVYLIWSTTTETYNKGFEIQHSEDGEHWKVLDFVNGVENSTVEQYYDYAHTDPVDGTNYYRLRQVDFDGKESYSSVTQLEINNSNIVSIYPNPTTDILNLNTETNYRVYNNMGQKMLEGNEKTIDVSALKAGLYMINIDGQIHSFTKL